METPQTAADPKDDRITNQDNSVTNHDLDSDAPNSTDPIVQDKPDSERVKTVAPPFQNVDPGAPDEKPGKKGDEEPEGSSNKDSGPSGENL